MTIARAFLESFDDPPAALEVELSYDDGYQAGYEAGLTEGQARQAASVAELSATLAAIASTHEAAQKEVVQSLRPLFDAICEQILPSLMRDLIGLQLVDALMAHAETLANAPVTVSASASDIETLRRAAVDAATPVEMTVDANLPAGSFSIRTATHEDMTDLSEICEAVRSALNALTDYPDGDTQQ